MHNAVLRLAVPAAHAHQCPGRTSAAGLCRTCGTQSRPLQAAVGKGMIGQGAVGMATAEALWFTCRLWRQP